VEGVLNKASSVYVRTVVHIYPQPQRFAVFASANPNPIRQRKRKFWSHALRVFVDSIDGNLIVRMLIVRYVR
jgi:hypothetical protein